MPQNALSIESLCHGLDFPDFVLGFDHVPGGKVLFGPGVVGQIGEEAKRLGAKRALLVTDPGIAKTGHSERAVSILKDAGIEVVVFDQVHENPTTIDVKRCVECASEAEVDLIIGFGGGSSMDTAKAANFILTNGGRMQDYQGVNRAEKPMLPLIAVPTTSGTGSECQSFALIADSESHAKMACGDKKAAAAVAILDPELTLTQPSSVTAHTGIDAVAHALETAVCNKGNDISMAYSRAAWSLLEKGLETVLAEPDNMKARARMQLGAAFAGTAIENSMLGIAHSCANPLTAHFGTVHGQAVGTMLPHVIRFNRQNEAAEKVYNELYPNGSLEDRVSELLVAAKMDESATDLGLTESAIDQLSTEAASQWTAQFNPVQVDAEALAKVYRSAL